VYVLNYSSSNVTVIDPANVTSTVTIGVGVNPYAAAGIGNHLYVANQTGGTVSVIDTGAGNAVSTLYVGSAAQNVIALSTKAYVANSLSDSISIIDDQIIPGRAHGVIYSETRDTSRTTKATVAPVETKQEPQVAPANPSGTTAKKAEPRWNIGERDLVMGMDAPEVRELQRFLNAHGAVVSAAGDGSVGNETIYFGARTRAALMAWQKAQGIKPASGRCGPLTRAAIAALGETVTQ
jgi:YVTN family beta-propeller protein